jgi:hypothetical protein
MRQISNQSNSLTTIWLRVTQEEAGLSGVARSAMSMELRPSTRHVSGLQAGQAEESRKLGATVSCRCREPLMGHYTSWLVGYTKRLGDQCHTLV